MSIDKRELRRTGLAVAATVVVIFLLYFGLAVARFCTWEEKGQFGDSFGGLTSLFSGLGLVGVALALYVQQEELSDQSTAITNSIDVQKRVVSTLSEQVDALVLSACAQTALLERFCQAEGIGSRELEAQLRLLSELCKERLERLKLSEEAEEKAQKS